MHFFRRIAASLENIQQRNVVDKRRLLRRCLFGMQKRGIVHQIRAWMSLCVRIVVISVFTDGAEPISASGTGLIDGNPHVIRIASPVTVDRTFIVDGVGFQTFRAFPIMFARLIFPMNARHSVCFALVTVIVTLIGTTAMNL